MNPADAETSPDAAPDPLDPETGEEARVVDSASLLRGARIALLSHNGVIYRLRATRAGKLILTK